MNLTPFLLFDGNCAEAMRFYQSCLGGELTLTALSDTPMKDLAPPAHHHKIAFAHLESGAAQLSGTDWMHPTRTPRQGNTVGVYLSLGTFRELRTIFDRLARVRTRRCSTISGTCRSGAMAISRTDSASTGSSRVNPKQLTSAGPLGGHATPSF